MSEALWPMPPVAAITFDERPYDEIFSPSFFADLCGIMKIRQTNATLATLRSGHFFAVRAYFETSYAFASLKTLKEENRRLSQVANDAERLYHSLVSLAEFGRTREKLTNEIQTNPTAYTSPEGLRLESLISQKTPHSLFAITAMLSDLSASAERAQVREAQTAQDQKGILTQLAHLAAESMEREIQKSRLSPSVSIPQGTRQHRPKGAALIALVSTFAPVWASLGAGTYNSGHSVEGLTGTKSRAVDAIFLTVKQLDKTCHRSAVTTAFRSWERSTPKTS